MPEDKRKELQKLFIRVDHMHELSNMQYHPSQAWLIKNNHDPSLVKRVHIPRAQQLIARSTWLKHPYVILHELAHAYHDQVLGFENEEIKKAYHRAEKYKLYELRATFSWRSNLPLRTDGSQGIFCRDD